MVLKQFNNKAVDSYSHDEYFLKSQVEHKDLTRRQNYCIMAKSNNIFVFISYFV